MTATILKLGSPFIFCVRPAAHFYVRAATSGAEMKMKNLPKSVLIAALFFSAIALVAIALQLYYAKSADDIGSNLGKAIALANDPSTNEKLLREVMLELVKMAQGLLQAAIGALQYAIGVSTLCSLVLFAIYRALKGR